MKTARPGFTMIELLVVMAIMAMLAAVGMVSYRNSGIAARDARRRADLETVRQALVLHRADTGQYPTPGLGTEAANWDEAVKILSGAGYLSIGSMEDPQEGKASQCPSRPRQYEYKGGGQSFEIRALFEEPNQDGMTCGNPCTRRCWLTNP